VVTLYCRGISQGKQAIDSDGSGIIKKGALDKIEGSCPVVDSGRYKYKVEATNVDKSIIGFGSREKYFPKMPILFQKQQP